LRIIIPIYLILAFLPGSLPAGTFLIPEGSEWRYLDDGSDPGEAWTDVEFDDSAWALGSAKFKGKAGRLGADSGTHPEHMTTYFRHQFHAPLNSAFRSLRVRVYRDDGAVLYLNGREVYRTNMPRGEIGPETPAASGVRGSGEWMETVVPADLIRPGTNVVAAEVHQIRLDSSDIGFDLELVGSEEAYLRAVKGPYLLFTGKSGSMTILWQLNGIARSRFICTDEEGEIVEETVTAEYGDSHQHRVTVSGLDPGAVYDYRVFVDEREYDGSFRTSPGPDASRVKMMAYGDTQTGSDVPERIHDAMLTLVERDREFQTLILHTGDWVRSDDEDIWTRQFFNPDRLRTRELIARVPIVGCIGNHDLWGGTFRKYWPFPYVEDRYWSFDCGPVHVTIVDVYSDYSPGSKQLAWIEEDLQSTDRPWKFLVLHEPGYSAGHHENNRDVQERIQPLCERYGVTAVFNGHNHYYARCVVNGVQHVTTGGGGGGRYEIDMDSPHLVAARSEHHFCTVEIDGDRMILTAQAVDGTVLDRVELTR
jgi:hypothetical protein